MNERGSLVIGWLIVMAIIAAALLLGCGAGVI